MAKNIKKLDANKYQIRFSYIDDLTGKRRRVRRRIDGTLQDAIAYRDQLRVEAHQGDLGRSDSRSKSDTLREMKDDWVRSRSSESRRRKAAVASSTHQKDMSVLEKHIMPGVGEWVPSGIQLHHLEDLTDAWASKRKRGGGGTGDLYSPVTVNNWIKVAKVFMGFCFRRVGRSTAILDDWQKLPTSDQGKKGHALTPPQAKALLDEQLRDDRYWYTLVYMLLATGQRFGSVTALEWDDVTDDWLIFATSHYKGDVKDGNKSGKVVRLPMTPDVKAVLEAHRQRMFAKQRAGVGTGLVFPAQVTDPDAAANNGYLEASSLGKVMAAACSDAGIPRTTPHDLRRTFNTWAAERVSGTVLRSITAHSSAGMTDHYYHGSREAKTQAIEGVTALVK